MSDHQSDKPFANLYVPIESGSSYLRLGTLTTSANYASQGEGDMQALLDKRWGTGGDCDDDTAAALCQGFIHEALDTSNLLAGSGWVDHTDGDRITTTLGNKVEIIGGHYKLIASKGQAGWDFSKGHCQMWSNTPGQITQAVDGEATELVSAKGLKYHSRFSGHTYDEKIDVKHFSSLIGEPLAPIASVSEQASRPKPSGSLRHPEELKLYHDVMNCQHVVEAYISSTHTDHAGVSGVAEERATIDELSESVLAADTIVERRAGATLTETEDASTRLLDETAVADVRGPAAVFPDISETGELPAALPGNIAARDVGGLASTAKVYAGTLIEGGTLTDSVNIGGHPASKSVYEAASIHHRSELPTGAYEDEKFDGGYTSELFATTCVGVDFGAVSVVDAVATNGILRVEEKAGIMLADVRHGVAGGVINAGDAIMGITEYNLAAFRIDKATIVAHTKSAVKTLSAAPIMRNSNGKLIA